MPWIFLNIVFERVIYMSILRVYKNNNYSTVHNGFINDKNLSLKAKGLLLYFLSKPDNWEFYLSEISNKSKDGVESVSAGIKELEKFLYIQRHLKRNDSGKLSGGYDFTVYEIPQEQPKEAVVLMISGAKRQWKIEKSKDIFRI